MRQLAGTKTTYGRAYAAPRTGLISGRIDYDTQRTADQTAFKFSAYEKILQPMIQFLKIIAAVSISRIGLFVINLLLLVLTVFLLYDIVVMILSRVGTISQIDDLTDNIATIMVAFGVLIEERHEVLKLIGSSPPVAPEDNLSDISLRYGVYFIIVGLFIEVFVEAMKIPIRFFEGGLLEETLIVGSVLLSSSGLVASALFARDLLFLHQTEPV